METSEGVLDAALCWWRKHDLDLVACEASDPSGTAPELWCMELSGCNPYASFGVQGWQCEYEPLCQAGLGWGALRELYRVKKRTVDAAEGDEG